MRLKLTLILSLHCLCGLIRAQQIDSVHVYRTAGDTLYRFSPQDTIARELGADSTELAGDTTRWFYDDQGLLQVQTSQTMKTSGWHNTHRTEYTYDSQHRLQKQIQTEWNGVYWAPVSRWTYAYNSEADTAQFQSVSYAEPQFNKWYDMQQITYQHQGDRLTATFAGTYWTSFYGEQRDSFIPLRINGQTHAFFGYALEAYGSGIAQALTDLPAPTPAVHKILRNGQLYILRNGILYDSMGRRY